MSYRQRERIVEAVQFSGGNLADFRKLVPPEAATFERAEHEAVLIMVAPDREPRLIHKGGWVSWDGQHAIVHSEQAFALHYEPV